jgi:16S rRNA (cytosine967-C5)-methyltransferase
MKGVSRGRRTALALLEAVERGQRLDVAWEHEAPGLPPQDRGWVHEAAFGTVRLRGRLDHLLDLHLDRGIDSLPPALLPILRLGAYQLLYMDGVPDYAAVSQAVSQARERHGRRMSGLVNGVLRSLAREGGEPDRFPSLEEDPEGHLATWGSHPRWLVRRWLARFGVPDTRALVEANNRIPDLYLRPLRDPVNRALEMLAEAGIPAQEGPRGSGTVRIGPGVEPGEALGRVPGIIQDPGSAWVVSWCGGVEGLRLADLCAAPGGKALALAALGARVVASDPSGVRLRRVADGAERLGLHVPVVVARGEEPPFRPTDVVLVDAPCSGTGTLRRHPDARWRLTPEAIGELARLQDRILDGAASVVRPGGLLVYSTCTLEPEENEDRIQAFLQRHPGFILEEGPDRTDLPAEVRDGPKMSVLPHRTGTDGSFAARLRRRRRDGLGRTVERT